MKKEIEIKIKGWWWKRLFKKHRRMKWLAELYLDIHKEDIDKAMLDFTLYGKTSIK